MSIREFLGVMPKLGENCFVAESADIIGDVVIGDYCGIWFGAVIRSDFEPVRIGNNTSIQDNATVHIARGCPAIIGSNVTVAHNAVVHGCTVEDNVMIGMGAIVLDGAVIGKGSIVGAGCVVGEGKIIPPRSLVVGVPGKVVRELDEERENQLVEHALGYKNLMLKYLDK